VPRKTALPGRVVPAAHHHPRGAEPRIATRGAEPRITIRGAEPRITIRAAPNRAPGQRRAPFSRRS
jgi:hypothetical protein